MKEKKIKLRATIREEVIPDLNTSYGIDAVEELENILRDELLKVLAITEDNLKEDGWVEGNSQTSNKKVWLKIIFDENKLPPLSVYEYDSEDRKLTYNNHSMTVLTMAEIRFYIQCRNDL